MKNYLSISLPAGKMENRTSYCLLALFIVFLPFDRFYTQLILALFIAHTLIYINRQRYKEIFSWQNGVLLSVFILALLGLLWSTDRSKGLEKVIHQSPILLIPLALSMSGMSLSEYRKNLLLVFIITSCSTILFLFLSAMRVILFYHVSLRALFSPEFINHNFSQPIHMHATYLALFISLALACCLDLARKEKNKTNRRLYLLGIAILAAGLLQLAAKSVLIATVCFFIIGYIRITPEKIHRIRFLLIIVAVLAIAFLALTQVKALKDRYVNELKDDLEETSRQISDSRVMRWQSALPLVARSPVIGYGTGPERKLLKEQYFQNKLYNSYLFELDAHNEYLSMLINYGILGLLVFLLTLYAGFHVAWRNGDTVFLSFMILVSVVSFSENILDVNKGIFFYAFFFTFFMLINRSATNPFSRKIKRPL